MLDEIINLYFENDKKLKEKYNRSLSFQDGLFDRFYRAKSLGFGENTSIYNSANIFGDVVIGKNTWVGPNVLLDGTGGEIRIGDNCSISAGVHIYTHDSVEWAISGGKAQFKKGSVSIGSNTYIGAQSVLALGIKIGSRSVIGANSFVNRDIRDNTIVAGNPAKSIGEVIIDEHGIRRSYYK